MYPDYGQTLPPTQIMRNPLPLGYPPISEPATAPKRNANWVITLISFTAIVAIGVAVYFMLGSSPASRNATALRNAVSNNQLVTLSGNDAYTYYMQLRSLDPTNSALKEVGQQVLPQLKDAGEEVFRKKTNVTAEKDTLQDWQKTQNIYEWAHAIEPNDKQIEARWRFAQGEVAKQQSRKDEAEKSYQAAAQLNNSWALPQNSLGLLRMENKRWGEAIPYFNKAISLQPDWEIPYNNLGTSYYYLKDFDRAEGWYRQALEKNPNWARPHFWLGSIYEQRGSKALAIEEYKAALALSRDNLPIDPFEIQRRIDKLSL
jgi:tetratricopeptide (TPR) repeat protein